MMRSTPNTKMAKPPPPVPPRPSKTIIAEALAKTKKSPPESAPVRVAPPPPVAGNVTKSSSSADIAVKRQSYERSVSEEVKTSSRTIVFQSSNLKSSKIHVNLSNEKGEKNDSTPSPEGTMNDSGTIDRNWNEVLNDRNHVNTLIDEMFASVLEIPDEQPSVEAINKRDSTILLVNHDDESKSVSESSQSSTSERKKVVKFDDKKNHELLISELQDMKKEQERILKRQRKPSQEIYEESPGIHHSDWVEVNDGEEIRLSSCQITIEDSQKPDTPPIPEESDLVSRLTAMASLHGLPPLPKSLSGFSLLDEAPNRSGSSRGPTPPASHYPPHAKGASVNGTDGAPTTGLDAQLAILRREMVSFRFCRW